MSTYDRNRDYFEQIDSILPQFNIMNGIWFDENMQLKAMSDLYEVAQNQLLLDGYMTKDPKGTHNHFLTSEGISFINKGGYGAKFAAEERVRILNEQQMESVIKTNVSSRRNNLWSPLFAGLAALVTIVSLINQRLEDRQQQQLMQLLQQQMKSKDSLLQMQKGQIIFPLKTDTANHK